MARVMGKLRQMGLGRCNLFVYGDNERGRAFWKRLGWRDWEDLGIRAMSRNIDQAEGCC